MRANSAGSGHEDGSFDARERALLSEHEVRAIDDLDRQLEHDDPDLAGLLRKMKPRRRWALQPRRRRR